MDKETKDNFINKIQKLRGNIKEYLSRGDNLENLTAESIVTLKKAFPREFSATKINSLFSKKIKPLNIKSQTSLIEAFIGPGIISFEDSVFLKQYLAGLDIFPKRIFLSKDVKVGMDAKYSALQLMMKAKKFNCYSCLPEKDAMQRLFSSHMVRNIGLCSVGK